MKNEDIIKASIFDFDGTLIDTLEPIVGKEIWKNKTGEDYPHKGWWGKRESLDLSVFNFKVFDDILNAYKSEYNNSNTFVALATGRISPLRSEVHKILDKHGVRFDEVALAGDKPWSIGASDTLRFKINYLDSVRKRFGNLKEMEIWDDRVEHHDTFIQWARIQNIPVRVNLVKH